MSGMIPVEQDELVMIKTPCVDVSIKGKAVHPSFPDLSFTESESMLKVRSRGLFETGMQGNAACIMEQHTAQEHMARYASYPLFFEQQSYELVIESKGEESVSFWHDNQYIRKQVTPVGRSGKILSGILNFGNDIGLTDLEIRVDGKPYLTITPEVFPSKIGYKDDYQEILQDVTNEIYNLAFDFLKKTYKGAALAKGMKPSAVEFYAILQMIYRNFIIAADVLLAQPHHILQTEREVLPGHKVKRTDNRSLRWVEKHPEQVMRGQDRWLVAKTQAVKKYVTYDTKENRLTKYMLQSTAKRLERFKRDYTTALKRSIDQEVVQGIDAMIHGILRRCNTGFMREVEAVPSRSGMSLVFSMAPGYRELYRYYLMLQHGLQINSELFHISVKDIAQLYEYWCFIKLNRILHDRYGEGEYDLVKTNAKGLRVSLKSGNTSNVKYKLENGEEIILSYNKSYEHLKADDVANDKAVATVSQRPDNVLTLKKKGAHAGEYQYVFDAKYKINPAVKGPLGEDSDYKKHYKTPGPQEDDINTMHRYRDAIAYGAKAERRMFGAYVLFPYHNEDEYEKHRFYKSIEEVNIGGLPFLPTATTLVSKFLDELISDSPDSAFERATLPVGIEERLAKVDWTKRDVLIGLVKEELQMNRYLAKRSFTVAMEQVNADNLPVHYVALYMAEQGIRYYGKVLSTREIQQEGVRYYRFDVEEWLELPELIQAKKYGPSAINYTNYFLLTHAETYPELHIHNEQEYRVYSELKRKSDQAVIQVEEEPRVMELGEVTITFGDQEIAAQKEDKVERITINQFTQNPGAQIRRIQRMIGELNKATETE